MANKKSKLTIPNGGSDIDKLVEDFVRSDKRDAERIAELERIRKLYAGGRKCCDVIEKPAELDESVWSEQKKLIMYINLVKPAVHVFVSGVYGGSVIRTIKAAPHIDDLKRIVMDKRNTYAQNRRMMMQNAVLFGQDIIVPVPSAKDTKDGDSVQTVRLWHPQPMYTWLIGDAEEMNEPCAVVEWLPNGNINWVSRYGLGSYNDETEETQLQPYDFGFFPASVCYGEDMRFNGNVNGFPLVLDAADFSVGATRKAWWGSVLGATQAKAILIQVGEEVDGEGFDQNGHPASAVRLEQGADAKFIQPHANFDALISLQENDREILAGILSLPVEALDPSKSPANSSAESARVRSTPLVQRIHEMAAVWQGYEIDAISKINAMIEFVYSGYKSQSLDDTEEALDYEIRISPFVVPESTAETVNTDIILLQNRIATPFDIAQKYNPQKSFEEVSVIADMISAKLDVGKAAEEEQIEVEAEDMAE